MLVEPVGHTEARKQLEKELPPVTLLLGPPSIGKWTLGEYLIQYHKVIKVDTRTFEKLTTDDAKELKKFASTASWGKFKVVLARLDHAHAAALNALLKVLEEPPPQIRFILICSGKTLATIISRSHTFRLGLLTVEEMNQVLSDRLGMAANFADKAARLGRGQVEQALSAEVSDAPRSSVLTVLKSVAEKDRDLFDQAMKSWDDVQTAESARLMLLTWVHEAVSGNWCVFNESETFGLLSDRSRLLKMMTSLHQLPGARPRLAVRVALEPFLSK